MLDIQKAKENLNKIKIDYDATYKHKKRYLDETRTNVDIVVEMYKSKDFYLTTKKTTNLSLNECIENIDKHWDKIKIQRRVGGSEEKKSCIALFLMMQLNDVT